MNKHIQKHKVKEKRRSSCTPTYFGHVIFKILQCIFQTIYKYLKIYFEDTWLPFCQSVDPGKE